MEDWAAEATAPSMEARFKRVRREEREWMGWVIMWLNKRYLAGGAAFFRGR